MDSAALYFYSICFCPVVSTQNFRDITKHDFSPVAPSSFVLLQSLSLSLSFIASLKQMAFYAGHNQDYSASGWAALPTCVQPNHNLMNTLGAVCSKLLPVGAKATGKPPQQSHFPPSSPPHLLCNSYLAHSPELILVPAFRPQLLPFNQIKIHICGLSAFQHNSKATYVATSI